mgnify:CR=1 FL=1
MEPPIGHPEGRKWERSSVPIRVAIVASVAVVCIPGNPIMVVVHRILVVVFMAIDATERTEITRGRMAFHAGVPFPIVGAAVDPEVLGVMVERGRVPC